VSRCRCRDVSDWCVLGLVRSAFQFFIHSKGCPKRLYVREQTVRPSSFCRKAANGCKSTQSGKSTVGVRIRYLAVSKVEQFGWLGSRSNASTNRRSTNTVFGGIDGRPPGRLGWPSQIDKSRRPTVGVRIRHLAVSTARRPDEWSPGRLVAGRLVDRTSALVPHVLLTAHLPARQNGRRGAHRARIGPKRGSTRPARLEERRNASFFGVRRRTCQKSQSRRSSAARRRPGVADGGGMPPPPRPLPPKLCRRLIGPETNVFPKLRRLWEGFGPGE